MHPPLQRIKAIKITSGRVVLRQHGLACVAERDLPHCLATMPRHPIAEEFTEILKRERFGHLRSYPKVIPRLPHCVGVLPAILEGNQGVPIFRAEGEVIARAVVEQYL